MEFVLAENVAYFIMVIELSGVQFGSKSNARFKIARPEVQLPLNYIHFEIKHKLILLIFY